MAKYVGFWALAGFLIAGGWAFYALAPGNGVNLGNSTIVAITCPIALLGRSMPISVGWSIVANTFTYALFGILLKWTWRACQVSRAHLSSR